MSLNFVWSFSNLFLPNGFLASYFDPTLRCGLKQYELDPRPHSHPNKLFQFQATTFLVLWDPISHLTHSDTCRLGKIVCLIRCTKHLEKYLKCTLKYRRINLATKNSQEVFGPPRVRCKKPLGKGKLIKNRFEIVMANLKMT